MLIFLFLFMELIYVICESSCGLQDSNEGALSKGTFWSQSSTVLDATNIK